MEKVELEFGHYRLPETASHLIRDCKEAGAEICARADGRGNIPLFVPADGMVSWNLLNSVVEQGFAGRTLVFCEWGSGLGLVTMLAALMGMSATGIEIEEELTDMARDFAQQHSVSASFINASIFPGDNPCQLIDYGEVDLFFVYPWPDEIAQVVELFSEVARHDAVLVIYHGGRNYRVMRQC